MDACPFLYDCSAWGAVEFLRALKVQVCERGDTLIRSGTLVSSMYILVRGEVKVQLADDPIEKETAEIYVQVSRPLSHARARAPSRPSLAYPRLPRPPLSRLALSPWPRQAPNDLSTRCLPRARAGRPHRLEEVH